MILQIVQDAIFAAVAAIGFAAISRPPLKAYPFCALIAAAGHSLRYWLMNPDFGAGMMIVPATLAASFLIGVLAVVCSPIAKTPAEACLFPALLPMIPGIYAYKAFGGLASCVMAAGKESFDFYMYQFTSNGLTCIFILLCMAVGATIPIFLFERISFQATRDNKRFL